MSDVRLLSPKTDLVETTADVLVAGGTADLSSCIAVFPGKRPAHVLRRTLARRFGTAYFPPQVLSVDLFIEMLARERTEKRPPVIGEFDAVALLFALHQALPPDRRIGGGQYGTLETFYPVGVKLFTEMEELTMAGVEPERLTAALSAVTLASAHTVAALFAPFYGEVRKRGFTSRALQYRDAADRIASADLSMHRRIVLAGFFAFTPTEERIVRRLLTLPNVTFLFQEGEGIRATLDALQCRPEREGETAEPETHFHESPDAHGQFFALNGVLAAEHPAPVTESDEAVIVLPSSDDLFPLYHQTLASYGQNTYNLALGYPVSRTPVYGFLMSLLEVAVTSRGGEVYVPKYLQFLLHPYTKNILFANRTDVTRITVHAVEERCRRNGARVFMTLDDVAADPRLAEEVVKRCAAEGAELSADDVRAHLRSIHDRTIGRFLSVRTVGEFSDACLDVLQFINDHSTAHRHPYFRPFVQTMLEQFVRLRESLLAPEPFEALDRSVMFLRHVAGGADVPFGGTPLQGLQVLGFLETRGLRFRTVYMVDVNDDVLPGRVLQDVLLPLQVRESLGLSTYRDQERIKAYIADVLRCGAERVHYFSINNDVKEPSRFIAQQQWRRQQQRGGVTVTGTDALEYRIDLSAAPPAPVRKTPAMLAVVRDLALSSTALDTYLACGLRFYHRFVLRLAEKEELSGDVERSDIGRTVHAILREFLAPAAGRPLRPEDLDADRLRRVVAENFRAVYGASLYGEQLFALRQTEKHLAEFMKEVQRPLAEGGNVVIDGLEEPLRAEIEGVSFTGFADRIETRGEKTVILDYKTGADASGYLIRFDKLRPEERPTWKEAVGSLQLPLYMMLVAAMKHVPPESIVPAFVFLGQRELDTECEVPLFGSDDEMREWFPALRTMVLTLAREMADPDIPFAPTHDIKNDCPGCPYRYLCGTQWAEKYSVL